MESLTLKNEDLKEARDKLAKDLMLIKSQNETEINKMDHSLQILEQEN